MLSTLDGVIPYQMIEELVRTEELKIQPFDPAGLEPATYDARVGKRILLSPRGQGIKGLILDLTEQNNEQYELPPGQLISVLTLERFTLPNDICARFGIRSSMQRKGILAFGGLQMDPGWDGHLTVSLLNVGPEPVPIKFGARLFSIEFHKLEVPTQMPYGSKPDHKYQHQDDFPSEMINFYLHAGTTSLAEIASLRERIASLEQAPKEQTRAGFFGFVLFGFFLIVSLISWQFFEPWIAIASLGVALTALLGGIASTAPSSQRRGRNRAI